MSTHSTLTLKPIPDCAGYAADEDGSIWSYWTPRGLPLGSPRYIGTIPRRLRTSVDRRDQRMYVDIRLAGKVFRRCVARLVCAAFYGPCPPGKECAHENGTSHDNRASNLAWKTHLENIHDKKRHGTDPVGVRHGMAKLNDEMVREIRALCSEGFPQKNVARWIRVSVANVSLIVNRLAWVHVS
jgi:hypothetical protein